MNPMQMPILTADNREPFLWNVVMTFREAHIPAENVCLILEKPDAPHHCQKEIFHQTPEGNARLEPDSIVTVWVNPDCGYFVETKQELYKELESGETKQAEVSRRLWILGEIQSLLRSPPELIDTLMAQSNQNFQWFDGKNLESLFSTTERLTLASLLPFKRNSHHMSVLSLMFSRILNLNVRFSHTLNNCFPIILSAWIDCPTEFIESHKRDQIKALEELLVPSNSVVIYTYKYQLALLDAPDAILDMVQLG